MQWLRVTGRDAAETSEPRDVVVASNLRPKAFAFWFTKPGTTLIFIQLVSKRLQLLLHRWLPFAWRIVGLRQKHASKANWFLTSSSDVCTLVCLSSSTVTFCPDVTSFSSSLGNLESLYVYLVHLLLLLHGKEIHFLLQSSSTNRFVSVRTLLPTILFAPATTTMFTVTSRQQDTRTILLAPAHNTHTLSTWPSELAHTNRRPFTNALDVTSRLYLGLTCFSLGSVPDGDKHWKWCWCGNDKVKPQATRRWSEVKCRVGTPDTSPSFFTLLFTGWKVQLALYRFWLCKSALRHLWMWFIAL